MKTQKVQKEKENKTANKINLNKKQLMKSLIMKIIRKKGETAYFQ